MTALSVFNLICGYEGKEVLRGISFEIEVGEFVGIVGPNGCGKTTLLRTISGLLPVWQGCIKVEEQDIHKTERAELAKTIAFVPQLMEPIEGFTVADMVLLGRTPHLNRFSFESEEDRQVARWAREELRIEKLSKTLVNELSGGEFQRVVIARALAQEPRLMLLDEPTSHLDIRYQVRILKLLRKLRQTRTIVATFHDLNMAARFCQKLLLLKAGEIVAFGRPDEVLTAENIWKAYRIKAEVKRNPKTRHARLVLLP